MGNLAGAYELTGRLPEAEFLRRQILAVRRRQIAADNPVIAYDLARLGGCLLLQERALEAESILRECLPIREQKTPDSWTRFDVQSLLGGALLGQKKYADAEPLLLSGYEGMKQREAKLRFFERKHMTDALDRLVRLYDAWGKPDEAAKWRAERAKYPPTQAPAASTK
jgi:hypothetical protein